MKRRTYKGVNKEQLAAEYMELGYAAFVTKNGYMPQSTLAGWAMALAVGVPLRSAGRPAFLSRYFFFFICMQLS